MNNFFANLAPRNRISGYSGTKGCFLYSNSNVYGMTRSRNCGLQKISGGSWRFPGGGTFPPGNMPGWNAAFDVIGLTVMVKNRNERLVKYKTQTWSMHSMNWYNRLKGLTLSIPGRGGGMQRFLAAGRWKIISLVLSVLMDSLFWVDQQRTLFYFWSMSVELCWATSNVVSSVCGDRVRRSDAYIK